MNTITADEVAAFVQAEAQKLREKTGKASSVAAKCLSCTSGLDIVEWAVYIESAGITTGKTISKAMNDMMTKLADSTEPAKMRAEAARLAAESAKLAAEADKLEAKGASHE